MDTRNGCGNTMTFNFINSGLYNRYKFIRTDHSQISSSSEQLLYKMPHLPELSKKEPSTSKLWMELGYAIAMLMPVLEAVIDNFKDKDDDFQKSISNSESRLAEGVHYDRNKAPSLQDREKARSEKVDVEGGSSSSVYATTPLPISITAKRGLTECCTGLTTSGEGTRLGSLRQMLVLQSL